MKTARIFLVSALATLLVIAIAGVLWFQFRDKPAAARIGGDFTLTNQAGAPYGSADLEGGLSLIYFGYTFCPDVCPTTLQDVARTMELLGEDAAGVTPVFITVDPERDTVEAVADYVEAFHPRMVGLTGTAAEIEKVKSLFRVYSQKAPVEGDEAGEYYLVDHQSIVFLMDRDMEFVAPFGYGTTPEEMAERVRKEL